MVSTQTQLFDAIMDLIDIARTNDLPKDEIVSALEDAILSVEDEGEEEI